MAAPDEVLASGDPIATALFNKYRKLRMPNLRLGEKDVAALIGFLEAKGVPSHATQTTELRPRVAVDAVPAVKDAGGLQN